MTEIQNRIVTQKSLLSSYYLNLTEQAEILDRITENKIIVDIEKNKKLSALLTELEDLEKITSIMKLIEEYEYEKMYTYSFVYDINYEKEEIKDILDRNKKKFSSNSLDQYSKDIENPSLKIEDDKIQIKFSKVLKNRFITEYIKYPVIVEFFLEEQFFQIKFESLENEYQLEEGNIFLSIVNMVEKWLENKLNINFKEANIFNKVTDLMQEISKNSKLYENMSEFVDYGRDQHNGDMKLKANHKDKLPLFAELRNLLSEFKCEEDKKLLETFLEKTDITIERYKRGIEWNWKSRNSKRKSRLPVVFSKNYENTSKTLIHLYQNSQSKERRDYVIKYIAKYIKPESPKKIS